MCRGDGYQASADNAYAKMLAYGQAHEGGQSRHDQPVAAYGCLGDLLHPAVRLSVCDTRQTRRCSVDALAAGHQRAQLVFHVSAQRRMRNPQGAGAPKRCAIGEEGDVVSGIHQGAAQYSQGSRVAFGAVGQCQEFHLEPI